MQRGILHIIGVDLLNGSGIPVEVLNTCHAIVTSDRFLPTLRDAGLQLKRFEIIPITPLAESTETIRKRLEDGDIAVLASGDPLFFGIGRRLIEVFGRDTVNVYPATSSIQHTFARFCIPWDDAVVVSLHGRSPENPVGTLLAHSKTAILTDRHNRPETIARDLFDFLGDNRSITLYVAENIGMDNEKLITGTIKEIADTQCGDLCCMLLARETDSNQVQQPTFGLTEEDIVHSRGLITKNEVRAAALHALAIPDNSILWDIGAGSGSIGLEAARMHRDMLIYSIEKETEQHANILANISRFGVMNLKLIQGEAPLGLLGLPRPQRIFIGGSGGNLADIIEVCAKELLPDGRIVVTAVLEKTRREAPELLYRFGLQVEMRQITVQRISYPQQEQTAFNPITIIIGRKC